MNKCLLGHANRFVDHASRSLIFFAPFRLAEQVGPNGYLVDKGRANDLAQDFELYVGEGDGREGNGSVS